MLQVEIVQKVMAQAYESLCFQISVSNGKERGTRRPVDCIKSQCCVVIMGGPEILGGMRKGC